MGVNVRPKMLDDVDERFVLECIENKSTAHGRRDDPVMYTIKRVKKQDFLKIANFSKTRRGLKHIRSAKSVYNKDRSHNKRSVQATRHFRLALFCTKKPPKLQGKENVLTHYQRVFNKNIFITRWGPVESSNANLFLSRDDKAIYVLVLLRGSFKKLFSSKEALHYVGLNFSCLCTGLH